MALPGAPCPWILQFFNDDGDPADGWKLHFLSAGTSNEKDTFSQADLDPSSVNANPVILDAAGRPPTGGAIFFEAGAYDIEVLDENDVLQFTVEGYENVAETFLDALGVELATGSSSVTTGYTVLATDLFVTVNSASGATVINLPAVTDHPLPLTIKNLGANTVAVTPDGAETIEGLAAAYSLPAASSPDFPTILLGNDGISGWWILSSHAL